MQIEQNVFGQPLVETRVVVPNREQLATKFRERSIAVDDPVGDHPKLGVVRELAAVAFAGFVPFKPSHPNGMLKGAPVAAVCFRQRYRLRKVDLGRRELASEG